jgi:O-antigen/teichoic acid export membrane protein
VIPTIKGAFLSRAGTALWSLGDQALSSGTNFILMILVARSVSATEFGAFAIAVSVYLLCLMLGRSSVSEAMVLSLGRTGSLVQTEAAAGFKATVLLSGAAAIVIASVAAFLPSGAMATILLVLAIGLPGLLAQDYKRLVFFARGEPQKAFASDALWAVLQVLGISLATASGVQSPAVLMGIWAASALTSGLVWPSVTRGWLRQSGIGWLRRESGLVVPLAGEGVLSQGLNQASVFALGAIAGLADAGAYRAAQSLFGPITVLMLGLRTAVLPRLMSMRTGAIPRALRLATGVAFVGAVVTAVWGGALVMLPDSVGREILGPTWAAAAVLLWLVAIDRTFNTLTVGSALRLRVLLRVRISFLVRVISAATGFGVSVLGAVVAGAWGVALGAAAVAPLLALLWWYAAARARRSSLGPERGTSALAATERGAPALDPAKGRHAGDLR